MATGEQMGRLVAAVIFGYISTGLLVILTDQIFSAMIPGFHSMKVPPLYYFVISLATNTFYSIVGGYLCSAVARAYARSATLALIVLGEVLGIIAQVSLWHTVPHWFGIGLLVLYAPAVWIGGLLRSRTAKPALPRAV
jgi:hypothetical protein